MLACQRADAGAGRRRRACVTEARHCIASSAARHCRCTSCTAGPRQRVPSAPRAAAHRSWHPWRGTWRRMGNLSCLEPREDYERVAQFVGKPHERVQNLALDDLLLQQNRQHSARTRLRAVIALPSLEPFALADVRGREVPHGAVGGNCMHVCGLARADRRCACALRARCRRGRPVAAPLSCTRPPTNPQPRRAIVCSLTASQSTA